jgi:Zn-dependent protease
VIPKPQVARCTNCGTELAPSMLACPSCHRLVHARELERLAAEARAAEERSDWSAALAHWRQALELLPPETRQAQTIAERIADLRARGDAKGRSIFARPKGDDGPKTGSFAAKILGPLGVVGLLLWKFKFLVVLVLSKAKFLLLGLSKAGSATSMVLFFGVYWAAFGWPLALGLVLSIYLHELGHVAAMKRLGMKIEAPMFIPGLGAYIRLRQRPVDAIEDARIGLAGPIWGLGAAVLSLALGQVTGLPIFIAIAKLGAWINLFNLLPVWQLDGGRAFHALARSGRFVVALAIGVAWYFSREGLLLLLLAVALYRTFKSDATATDKRTLVEFVGLIATLSALAALPLDLH